MDRDSAALIAQVIPVVALGLGLELRALQSRMKALHSEQDRTNLPEHRAPLATTALASAAMIILMVTEIHALAVATTGLTLLEQTVLNAAIVIVFLMPVIETANALRASGYIKRMDRLTLLLILGGLALTIVPLLLLSAMLS
jgi:hypothetical protein